MIGICDICNWEVLEDEKYFYEECGGKKLYYHKDCLYLQKKAQVEGELNFE